VPPQTSNIANSSSVFYKTRAIALLRQNAAYPSRVACVKFRAPPAPIPYSCASFSGLVFLLPLFLLPLFLLFYPPIFT
jgi:hypothetical protein